MIGNYEEAMTDNDGGGIKCNSCVIIETSNMDSNAVSSHLLAVSSNISVSLSLLSMTFMPTLGVKCIQFYILYASKL